MATWFGRRYMRDKVPTTEVVIGLVVLLVLAGIVVVAIAVGVHPQPGLFVLKPGAEGKSPPTREERIARQMLPALGTAGWSRQEGVQVLDREALEAADESELLQAGAVWVYRGTYARAGTGESVSVQIVDAETPANASGLYERRKPREAAPLAVGNAGWRTEQRGGFWSGRYYTEFDRSNVRSETPSARTIADALGSVQIAYAAAPAVSVTPAAAPVERASPFPAIEVADWAVPADWRVYTPLDLWEKINGRADIYLQFDMQRMTFGTYRCRTDPNQALDVYWYEMAAPEGAFGIYQAESGGQVTPLEVGDAGYGAHGSVIFRKGNHYVRVEANGQGASIEAAGPAVARAVAGRIQSTAAGPWAEFLLPREGRTGAELAYHGADAFSLDFLRDVFSADYSAEGKTFTTFIHRAGDRSEATKLLNAYAVFFQKNGRLLERGRADGIEFLVGESGGTVDAAFVVGVYLGGVNNCGDAALAKEKALSLARALGGRTAEAGSEPRP